MSITFQKSLRLTSTPIAYKYYKWHITAIRDIGIQAYVQLSEFTFLLDSVDTDMSLVTISLLNGHTSPDGENAINLKDGNLVSKFLDYNFEDGGTEVLFEFPTAIIFNGYKWGTGNDSDWRDPKSWTLYGSNDNTNWDVLDTVTDFIATVDRSTFNTPFSYTPTNNIESKLTFTANPPIPAAPSIVLDGLVLYYDFGNPSSYSGNGSTINDLSTTNNTGSIVNDYGHLSYVDSGSNSYFNWDSNSGGNGGSNSFGSSIWTTSENIYKDFTMIIEPDFSIGGFAGLFSIPNDKSLRIYNNNWQFPNNGNDDDWGNPSSTFYVNGQVTNQMVSGWNIIGGAKNNNNPAFPDNGKLYVGTSGYDSRHMKGKIAVVLMYNRTLTEQEQLQNYNFFKFRFGLVPIG
jgi:hypothetical protein